MWTSHWQAAAVVSVGCLCIRAQEDVTLLRANRGKEQQGRIRGVLGLGTHADCIEERKASPQCVQDSLRSLEMRVEELQHSGTSRQRRLSAVESSKEELEQSKKLARDYKAKSAQAERQLAESQRRAAEMEARLEGGRDSAEMSRGRLEECKGNLETVTAARDTCQTDAEQGRLYAETCDSDREKLKRSLKDYKDRVPGLEKQLAPLQEAADAALAASKQDQARAELYKSNHQECKGNLETITAARDTCFADAEQGRLYTETCDSDREKLVKGLKTCKDRLPEIEVLEEQLGSLKETAAAAQAASKKDQARAELYKSDYQEALREVQACSRKSSEMKDHQDAVRTALAAETSKSARLQKSLEEATDRSEQQLVDLQALHKALDEWKEDPDLSDVMRAKALAFYKNNPGLAGAYNHTSQHVLPHVRGLGTYLNQTHQAVHFGASMFLPMQYLPLVSGVLTYGIIFMPMLVTIWCLTNITAVLSVRPMLIFCHLYCLFSAMGCAVTSWLMGVDPFTLVQELNPGVYTFMQLLLGFMYASYVLLQCIAVLRSGKNNDMWGKRVFQTVAVVGVGLMYYKSVWEPAMLSRPPSYLFMSNVSVAYLVPAAVFAAVLHVEKHHLGSKASAEAQLRQTMTVVVRSNSDEDEEGGGKIE